MWKIVKWYDTVQVKLNTDVYSWFASMYSNLVITDIYLRLVWVEWSVKNSFACVVWLLINIARVVVKVRVGFKETFKSK